MARVYVGQTAIVCCPGFWTLNGADIKIEYSTRPRDLRVEGQSSPFGQRVFNESLRLTLQTYRNKNEC